MTGIGRTYLKVIVVWVFTLAALFAFQWMYSS